MPTSGRHPHRSAFASAGSTTISKTSVLPRGITRFSRCSGTFRLATTSSVKPFSTRGTTSPRRWPSNLWRGTRFRRPRVVRALEPGVHAVRASCRREDGLSSCAVDRHWRRLGAHCGRFPGRPEQLRHRPVTATGRSRCGNLRQTLSFEPIGRRHQHACHR